jgi:tetratricopeptide (TPR) repeat protein
MRYGVFAVAAMMGVGAAAPAAAQQRQFAPPSCDVNKGHYLVNSAILYLQNAGRTRFADQRQRDLRDASRVLNEAIREKGQDQNGSAWYYLARYYQELNDVEGADSAFDRAERMLPHCAEDIRQNRRRLWVPLLNGGIDRLRAEDSQGAMEQFRRANRIYDAEPPSFYYMAREFFNAERRDSAIIYFQRALAIASDSLNRDNQQYAEVRSDAAFNIARMFHLGAQATTDAAQSRALYDSAAAWYTRARAIKPNDPDAITGLASALQAAGRMDDALPLYDSVLARADSMTALDLFQTGVALFRAKRFNRAADAFERGLQRNPHYRDALFNLGNTFLSLANAGDTGSATTAEKVKRDYGAKMTPIVARLVAADPANTGAQRLLAASYQLQEMSDSTLAVLQRIEAMPFEIVVSTFQPSDGTWEVRGIITNLKSQATQVPVITFEFLSEGGEVVETAAIDAQELPADGVVPFALVARAESVAAWRYRVGA